MSIDAPLVRRLVGEQCQHLADPHLLSFAHGWDNELFALGPDLLVRLPRRTAASILIDHEIAVLPRLAPRLPVPVPVPVFAGRPGRGYPWRWTVVPRLPGRIAADFAAPDRSAAATGLASLLTALHAPADQDAPTNPFRGVPLAVRAQAWEPQLRQMVGDAALARWRHWADAAVFALSSDDLPALAAVARHGLAATLSDAEFGPGEP